MDKSIVFVKTESFQQGLENEVKKHIRIVHAVMDEVIPFIPEFVKSGVEVVITRGYTAELINKMSDLHVLQVEITSFDVLKSMYDNRNKISPQEKEIGFINYYSVSHDINMMEQLIGLKINQYTYKKYDDIVEAFKSAKKQGIKTIFGGPVSQKLAPELNIQGILVRSSRETVMQAIQKSKEIATIRKRDKELNTRLNSILNLTSEGIIDIDTECNINLNPAAQRILKIDANSKGKFSDDSLPPDLLELLKTHQTHKEKLLRTKNSRIVVSSTPILIGDENIGCLATINDVTDVEKLEEKIRIESYKKGLTAKFDFTDIIGQSETLLDTIKIAKHFSKSEATILITGESGTGKELFAQSIHQNSHRKFGPFVAVNCAAISENLLESEFFGYAYGAFTGARKDGKPGMFELANNGTLFLDEIGEIPLHLQSKLLRVLQSKEVMRVGGSRIIPINVRVVAATNKNLKVSVDQGLFRNDLYYRLDVLKLIVPPLRERLQDIPLLVKYFIAKKSGLYGKTVSTFSDKIIGYLKSYTWPGNIRQLEAFVEKYVVLSDLHGGSYERNPDELAVELLKQEFEEDGTLKSYQPTLTVSIGTLEEMEIEILKQLETIHDNKQHLAEELGVSRSTLWRKLQQTKTSDASSL